MKTTTDDRRLQDVIATAARLQAETDGRMSADELLAIGAQLGITDVAMRAAIAKHDGVEWPRAAKMAVAVASAFAAAALLGAAALAVTGTGAEEAASPPSSAAPVERAAAAFTPHAFALGDARVRVVSASVGSHVSHHNEAVAVRLEPGESWVSFVVDVTDAGDRPDDLRWEEYVQVLTKGGERVIPDHVLGRRFGADRDRLRPGERLSLKVAFRMGADDFPLVAHYGDLTDVPLTFP